MMHSVPNTERVAPPWALPGRWLDGLRQFAGAVLLGALRLRGFASDTPELRMSPEWLEEHEQRARKHPEG
jgi:hypothetical protein